MKIGNRITYFIQEVIIVTVGVLIAFSINSYKEKTENEAYVRKTLSAIEREIRLNQSGLDTVLNRHIEMVEVLETRSTESEEPLGEMIGNMGGFQVASLKNISLRFFVSNKAELLDFQLISQLQAIENGTAILKEKVNRLADFAYAHINDRERETKITFSYFLLDVIESEQSLMKAYNTFLEDNATHLEQGRE